MRDLAAILALGILLGTALAAWTLLLAPCEWHDGLWKNPYWPFSVETAVRDR